MSKPDRSWTDEEILDELLGALLTDIYRTASRWTDIIRDAASDENPSRLRDRLIELQIGVVVGMFSYIDGSRGPTFWPGIKLVNAETHRSLSDDLCWELSRVESEVIDAEEDDSDAQGQAG